MSRSLGPYFPLSAHYADDPAIMELSPAAELLYIRILAYAAQLPTDGFVTYAQVRLRCASKLRYCDALLASCIDAALLVPVDDGLLIRSWLKWNTSAADLGRVRRQDRDRKAARRAAETAGQAGLSGRTGDDVRPDSDRSPAGHPADTVQIPAGVRPRAAARARSELNRTELNGTEELPPSAVAAKPRAPTNTSADVVAAFVDARKAAGLTDSGKERVGREAKTLLTQGLPLEELIAAAQSLGATQWDGLGKQVNIRKAVPRRPYLPALDDIGYRHSNGDTGPDG